MNKDQLKKVMQEKHDPKEIAKNKANMYINFCAERLVMVSNLIKNKNFEEVKKYLSHSSAGDGYGSENDYLNFGYDTPSDILEAIEEIKELLKFADSYDEDEDWVNDEDDNKE